ncbi:MAG: saccharopine dehydrogenase NADP-binding domain-containing protein [Candidatus Micrarchaeota archaeon]|nr:saccharopine dehydrogenase NADP-binding domain-containing protein [Candidatus Micrarchaeota archaeon]
MKNLVEKKQKKIVLVGVGATGSVIAKLLAKQKENTQIICITNNIKKAFEYIDEKNPKIKLVEADASKPKQIIKFAKGASLILNASLPKYNKSLMRVALEVGANYQDMCSELEEGYKPDQLKYSQEFKEKNLIALINTGVSPGVTNLLAKEASEMFDEVEWIKFRIIQENKADRLVFSWSATLTLEEITAEPVFYEYGQFKKDLPFSRQEEYHYPAGFGKKICYSIQGDEVCTIPLFIDVRLVDYKISGEDIRLFYILNQLGMFSKKKLKIANTSIAPIELFKKLNIEVPNPKQMIELKESSPAIENSVFASTIDVYGIKDYRPLQIRYTAVYPSLKNIPKEFAGATYISYPTGIAAATFSKYIDKIKIRGVIPPEALSRNIRKAILDDLKNQKMVLIEDREGLE